MTQSITIGCQARDGKPLEATFLPETGLNMRSFRKGDIEVIDQDSIRLFEERFAGLGALIGPHFHRRNSAILPKIEDESLFPHIARVRAKGGHDPFSHGIARYAPWKIESSAADSFRGVLTGEDRWNGVPLSALQGQKFKMAFQGKMTPEGLRLHLSIISDSDSLVGLHYYYRLGKGAAKVTSDVQSTVRQDDLLTSIPKDWNYRDYRLTFPLTQAADFGFFPYRNELEGKIRLETEDYTLDTHYSCTNQENSWQLYHPADSSFVCIEPLSARNPRKPILTVSALTILLQIH